MLRSISWSQFITFLLLGIIVYYAYFGWVCHEAGLLKFIFNNRAPGQARATGRIAPTGAEGAVATGTGSTDDGLSVGPEQKEGNRLETDKNVSTAAIESAAANEKGGVSQNKEIDIKETVPNAGDNTKALLETAEMAIMGVKHVVEQAVGSGISWEEIKARLQMVLSGCQALRGTAHVAAVNGFIERNCRASFALVLSEEDLQKLWDGGETEMKQHMPHETA